MADTPEFAMVDPQGGGKMPIPVSFVLMAAAKNIENGCRRQNFDFLVCKRENNHPDACVTQGFQVQKCVHDTLKNLNQKCPQAFSDYCDCMAESYCRFEKCRAAQAKFDACVGGK